MIAGRKTTGYLQGRITFSGQPRSSTVMRSTAYVMQDNVHYGELTVLETLQFASKLRYLVTLASSLPSSLL